MSKLNRIKYHIQQHNYIELFRLGFEHINWIHHNNSILNRIRLKQLQNKYSCIDIDPLDIIYVSPDKIEYVAGSIDENSNHWYHFEVPQLEFEIFPGIVVGGDWDKSNYRFDCLSEYRMLEQRILHNYDWHDTDFVQKRLDSIGTNSNLTEDKLLNKLNKYDKIISKMSNGEVKSQREMRGPPLEEICAMMGRDNKLYFVYNGRHRLAIAKILDINVVPILLLGYHSDIFRIK